MSDIKPWRECIGKHEAYMIMCEVIDVLYEKEAIKKTVYERLKQAPSTDSNGHWIDRTDEHGDSIGIYPWEVFKCSECGHLTAGNEFNFCPNCGADMRGGNDETIAD